MQKCHLDYRTAEDLGHAFYRVDNDVNGNPRYVIHYLAFSLDYDKAVSAARSIGFRRYRARAFGGGFVGQSYDLESTARDIIAVREAILQEAAA